MNKKYAYLFPGQGSQYIGMGKDFAASFAIAKHTFEEADHILKMNLAKLMFEGSEEELVQTKNSQLAIFVNSVAVFRTLLDQMPNLEPSICAGLSLGEYSALYATQKLSFQETLLLVRTRSHLMHEACEKKGGTMAAVLGLSEETLLESISGIDGVWAANYNCPGQIVISGTRQGVEKASQVLKEKGAKRVLPLHVAGAFHSGLMQEAQDLFAPFVLKAPIIKSDRSLVMNVTGKVEEDPTEIQKNLITQISGSVHWQQGILEIEKRGVDLYLEVGCGKTLTGFNRKIGVSAPTLSVDRIEDLESVAKHLQGEIGCTC